MKWTWKGGIWQVDYLMLFGKQLRQQIYNTDRETIWDIVIKILTKMDLHQKQLQAAEK